MTPSSRALDIDLRVLGQGLRQSWQSLLQSRGLAWMTPDLPVRVLHADGREAVWRGAQVLKTPPAKVAFEALEIPEDLLLRRSLRMPALPAAQIEEAVWLDIRSASPFRPDDTVGAYAAQPQAQGGLAVDVVLASRAQLAAHLAAQAGRLRQPEAAELWALAPTGAPMVLAGWGEARRQQGASRQRHLAYALMALALGLVGALAVTPTAQLRLRAIAAVYDYDAVHARTLPLVKERAALLRTTEQVEAVRALLVERVDPIKLLETLTHQLPDDTSLQSLQVNGLKATITGLTANSANLMQLLGGIEGFKEVRAPSAATRYPGATAESFNIEFQLDPAIYALMPAPAKPAPTEAPAEGGQAPAEAPPSGSSPVAPASSAAPVPPAAPASAAPASAAPPAAAPAPSVPAKPGAPAPAAKPGGKFSMGPA